MKKKSLLKSLASSNCKPQYLSTHYRCRKRNFLIQLPEEIDLKKKYPLIIGLHGNTNSSNSYFIPIIVNNPGQAKEYPCFYLAPNNKTNGWGEDAVWVRSIIKEMLYIFQIDPSRIYIIGFSRGGSGSFLFSDFLYNELGVFPAAIIRCAGLTNDELSPIMNMHTAVWYHVGSSDSKEIERIAQSFYQKRKEITNYIEETNNIDIIDGYVRQTYSLWVENREKIKMSIYWGMGHTFSPIFSDSSILKWLFDQRLRIN